MIGQEITSETVQELKSPRTESIRRTPYRSYTLLNFHVYANGLVIKEYKIGNQATRYEAVEAVEAEFVEEGIRYSDSIFEETPLAFIDYVNPRLLIQKGVKKLAISKVSGIKLVEYKGKLLGKNSDVKNKSNSMWETPNRVNYGDQYTKDGRKKVLKANVEYSTKEGYIYKTDSKGRISSCEGNLILGKGKRNNYAQRKVGREDRLADDEGGHLIASIFKGSGNMDNLVPMNGNLNKGEWKKLENSWAEALRLGDEVKVKIIPIYKGDLKRPDSFEIKYKIGEDGCEKKRLDNVRGGKFHE